MVRTLSLDHLSRLLCRLLLQQVVVSNQLACVDRVITVALCNLFGELSASLWELELLHLGLDR